MAINLEREVPITLANAPALIPAINAAPGMDARKPLHERTIRNWSTRGKRGVVLETVMIGGILVTTKEAIARFFDRLTMARENRFIEQERIPENARRRSNARHAEASVRRFYEKHG